MSPNNNPAKKKRSEQRKRNQTLHCRALPAEAALIKKIAEELDMSVSEVLRQAALHTKIRPPRKRLPSPDRQMLARLTGQLGKVGSNLNQLAHHANREGALGDTASLKSAVSECRDLIAYLTQLLK